MSKTLELLGTLFAVATGVAIVSLLISNNAQTAGIIQSLFSGLSNSVAVAESPVTGTTVTPNLSYPTATNSSGAL